MNYFENLKSLLARRPLIVVVVVILLIALSVGGYSSCRSYRYDKGDAKAEAEKQKLIQERDAAIKQANDAEARATFSEAKNAETDKLIAASTGKIKEAEKDLEKRIEEAKRSAGSCDSNSHPDDFRRCVRAKLAALGY